MSTTTISPFNKNLLWIYAAGRCQYRGCNKVLHTDILTRKKYNQAYIAHIVADQPGGPRGDIIRSPLLKDSLDNLMLLCDSHHRLIDKIDVKGHPEPILLEMKREHEDRIASVTAISPDKKSHVVCYSANIGVHTPNVSFASVSRDLQDYYPAQDKSIDLGLVNSLDKDNDPEFWITERRNLIAKFTQVILPLIKAREVNHISLFAFAPIPLLIQLGILFNDISSVEVRQKKRVPDSWTFESDIDTDYLFIKPRTKDKNVALKLELSGDIADSRIHKVLDDACIYSIRIANPDNDFVRSRKQISDFGKKMRQVLNEIKLIHGQDAILHVFPASPVSTAVEFGRVWMPKADLKLKIYDQSSLLGGFVAALDIE